MLSSLMAFIVAAFIAHAQPQATKQNINLSVLQTECLTEAIYFESRGEGDIGGAAVSYVIQNRAVVEHKSFCEVIHDPGQFSFYHRGQPLQVREIDAWKSSAQIAVETQLGSIKDPIGNATFYNTTPFYGNRHIVFVARIKHHLFYGYREIVYAPPLISIPSTSPQSQIVLTDYQEMAPETSTNLTLQSRTKTQTILIHVRDRFKIAHERDRFRHRYKKMTHHRYESRSPHRQFEVRKTPSIRPG